jgi:hypothetical protein
MKKINKKNNLLKKIIFFAMSNFAVAFIFTFFFCAETAEAAYSSQCQTGQESGQQTGCTHDNDDYILKSQCKYSSIACSTMSAYLIEMSDECKRVKPEGIDCAMIAQNGYYGREAGKFATYIENNSGAINPSAPSSEEQSRIGELVFPTQSGLPDPTGGLKGILRTLLFWLLSIIGVIALISFVIAGIQYLMATGNERTIEAAKRNLTYSILGIIIALSGFVIIQAIDYALRATNSLF